MNKHSLVFTEQWASRENSANFKEDVDQIQQCVEKLAELPQYSLPWCNLSPDGLKA